MPTIPSQTGTAPQLERQAATDDDETASLMASDPLEQHDEESAELWRKIQKYVAEDWDEVDETGVGGELWPAAVALCCWMANETAGMFSHPGRKLSGPEMAHGKVMWLACTM